MVDPSPRRSHVATFGMGVNENYQGQGVASTLMQEMVNLCDNWLRIKRIELTVYTDNARHWRSIVSLVLKSRVPVKALHFAMSLCGCLFYGAFQTCVVADIEDKRDNNSIPATKTAYTGLTSE